MSFLNIRPIPTAEEITQNLMPVPKNLHEIKKKRDAEIKSIIEGKSSKFLVIIGPCSASDEDALLDYVTRLAKLQEEVKDSLFIIPRVYTMKPRTTGAGYKGMLHQPNPTEAPNMVDGLLAVRGMHLRVIAESGLTSADEILYTDNLPYFEDIVSYIAIGARSVENQQHRLATSGIDIPVGMKNPTSGNLTVMLNSIQAAQGSHNFIYREFEVKTSGNPLAHAVLRGYINKHGEEMPNYHYEDLTLAIELYGNRNLSNPTIIVDTSHANARKRFYEQPRIAKEVLNSRRYDDNVKKMVRGLMIESYIEEGSQSVTDDVYGKSITDPCLGWEDSVKLVYHLANHLT